MGYECSMGYQHDFWILAPTPAPPQMSTFGEGGELKDEPKKS